MKCGNSVTIPESDMSGNKTSCCGEIVEKDDITLGVKSGAAVSKASTAILFQGINPTKPMVFHELPKDYLFELGNHSTVERIDGRTFVIHGKRTEVLEQSEHGTKVYPFVTLSSALSGSGGGEVESSCEEEVQAPGRKIVYSVMSE